MGECLVTKDRFKNGLILILILLTIVYLCTQVSFLLEPIGIFFTTLFMPLLLSGFLYFMFSPTLKFVQKKLKLQRTLSVLLLYVLFFSAIGLGIAYLLPIFIDQLTSFANDLPTYARQVEDFIAEKMGTNDLDALLNNDLIPFETIQTSVTDLFNTLPTTIASSVLSVINFVADTAILLVTVPILLFYMLKDGHKFPNAFSKFIPERYRKEGLVILKDVGNTLSAYISGQVLVACVVGTISFIGYIIIDMPYALLLASIIAVTNIIPYIGPILGGAPAVIIAIFDSPLQILLVVIVILVAQQLEGNVISPLILGKSLNIHPATVVIILLVAGNLAGILGMVLAIPTYAVAKTIVVGIVQFWDMRKEQRTLDSVSSET